MQSARNSQIPVVVDERGYLDGAQDELDDRVRREIKIAHIRLLWNERHFLFRAAAYGFILFTVIAFLIPNRYESTASVMPPDNQAGANMSSGMAMLAALTGKTGGSTAVLAGDLLGMKTTSAIFIGVLRSRTVQDRLIDRFDLRKVYGVRTMQDAREKLAGYTSITEDRKSGIITVVVTDKNPQRAAGMARGYVDELNRLVAELTTSSAHRERVFLEQRLKTVKSDLDAASREFSEFASKNTTIDIKEQGRAMVESAARLQGQVIAAQSELEGLRQIYTDKNVRVRTLEARVTELQKQIEKISGVADQSSGNAATQGVDAVYPSIRKLPLLGVTYSDLFRRTKIEETVYELLTQQYEMAKVQEAKEIPTVKVLDNANVPEKKAYPHRLLIMLFGVVFSFVLGVVWVNAHERWYRADAHDPAKSLAIEILEPVRARLTTFTGDRPRLQAGIVRLSSHFRLRNGASNGSKGA